MSLLKSFSSIVVFTLLFSCGKESFNKSVHASSLFEIEVNGVQEDSTHQTFINETFMLDLGGMDEKKLAKATKGYLRYKTINQSGKDIALSDPVIIISENHFTEDLSRKGTMFTKPFPQTIPTGESETWYIAMTDMESQLIAAVARGGKLPIVFQTYTNELNTNFTIEYFLELKY